MIVALAPGMTAGSWTTAAKVVGEGTTTNVWPPNSLVCPLSPGGAAPRGIVVGAGMITTGGGIGLGEICGLFGWPGFGGGFSGGPLFGGGLLGGGCSGGGLLGGELLGGGLVGGGLFAGGPPKMELMIEPIAGG